jgi:hypothetical protein
MNARFRPYPSVFLLGLFGVSTIAMAQEQLPKAMTGTWDTTNQAAASGRIVTSGGTWSVVIDKQNPDGSLVGKMTFSGSRLCEADNDPITGRYDGTELTIRGTLRDKFPNAGCGRVRFVLKKSGAGFEGGIPGAASPYRVTLKPS